MKAAVTSVGWVAGGAGTETRAGALWAEAPPTLRAIPVRPARFDLRSLWDSPPERLARMDRLCHLSLAAVRIALRARSAPREPVAVVHESGLATIGTNERFFAKLLRRGPRGVDPKRFPYTSPNAAAGEIAIAFGFRGANLATTPGLTGGLLALAAAHTLLRAGRAASVIVVGADALSLAAVAWLVASGQGLGPPGEAGVALVLEPESAAAGALAVLEATTVAFCAGHGRSVRGDAEAVLGECGDLPGSGALLAIARAASLGSGCGVGASGPEGATVQATLGPR